MTTLIVLLHGTAPNIRLYISIPWVDIYLAIVISNIDEGFDIDVLPFGDGRKNIKNVRLKPSVNIAIKTGQAKRALRGSLQYHIIILLTNPAIGLSKHALYKNWSSGIAVKQRYVITSLCAFQKNNKFIWLTYSTLISTLALPKKHWCYKMKRTYPFQGLFPGTKNLSEK